MAAITSICEPDQVWWWQMLSFPSLPLPLITHLLSSRHVRRGENPPLRTPDRLSLKELAILLDVALPLLWYGVIGEDGLDRAFWFARATINAFVGVDVILVVTLINAIHRTDRHARGVFRADARLSNNVWHRCLLPIDASITHTMVVCFQTTTDRIGPSTTFVPLRHKVVV